MQNSINSKAPTMQWDKRYGSPWTIYTQRDLLTSCTFGSLAQVNPVTSELQLTHFLMIHLVFHVSHLKPYTENPFPLRASHLSHWYKEYRIHYILDSKHKCGGLWYLVYWEGYSPEERIREPVENVHALTLVWALHRNHP